MGFRGTSPENIPNNIEMCKTTGFLMGQQALTSKESELARSPSKSVKPPSPHGIPREPPLFPGLAPMVFRRQLNKFLCWDLGPDSSKNFN